MIYRYGSSEADKDNFQRLLSSETKVLTPVQPTFGLFRFETPLNSIVLIDSSFVVLSAGIVVANRRAVSMVTDLNGNYLWACQSALDQPAGANVLYSFARGSNTDVLISNFVSIRLPDIIIHSQQVFTTFIQNIQVGDGPAGAFIQYKILNLDEDI